VRSCQLNIELTLIQFRKGILFIIGISCLLVIPVFAGPPFITDDPEPVPFKHWEFYLSSIDYFQSDSKSGTLPHFEVNYGVLPNIQLHLQIPLNYLSEGNKFDYGYGNTEIGAKIRFLNLAKSKIQLGVFPVFQIPTVQNENFSSSHIQSFLPVWIQKTRKKLTTYGGAGYCFNSGSDNQNWQFVGWEAQYDFTQKLTLGGEVFYKTAATEGTKDYFGFNLGGFLNFTEHFHFIFSVGQTITGEKGLMAYGGLLWTI
jgi:hypothetical protein